MTGTNTCCDVTKKSCKQIITPLDIVITDDPTLVQEQLSSLIVIPL